MLRNPSVLLPIAIFLISAAAIVVFFVPLSVPNLSVGSNGESGARSTSRLEVSDMLRTPFSSSTVPDELPVIQLRPTDVRLLVGGVVIREMPLASSEDIPFESLEPLINDPQWIERISDGTFLVKAAIIQTDGSSLVVSSPGVQKLRLLNSGFVFLAGIGSTARIEGVTVESWDPATGGPAVDSASPRPFIGYEKGSRLDILRSDIGFLGSDREGAYGISIREEGSTGTIVDSNVHDCFFGIYTFEAHDIVVRNNTIHNNAFYGIDPHDYTTGMVVEGNEVYANGKHGIVFSVGVTGGRVTGNSVYGNGANGIIMDSESNRNVIENNKIDNNLGHGIVLDESSDNIVRNNVVSGSAVGIRANKDSRGNQISGNVISNVDTGMLVNRGASRLLVSDNRITNAAIAGVILDSSGTQLSGGSVENAPIGVELRGGGRIDEIGFVNVATPLVDSRKGVDTDAWLPVVGIAILIAALGLEGFRRLRQQPVPLSVEIPAIVRNRS